MATQKYIGARYVPRFLGTYDNTQQYEALDVVDNGSGTSYIAQKPVPAGTPLNDTDYWFVYGASSGAIYNLQTRMGNAENDITSLQNRMGTAEGNITSLQTNLGYLKNTFSFEAGQKICIIADSVGSDTVTYLQPAFSTYLKTWFQQLGCQFDIYGLGGRTWGANVPGSSGGVMDAVANITTQYDIIIVQLGINDWQLQDSDSVLSAALNNFETWRITNQPNAQIFCMLPLSTPKNTSRIPLNLYVAKIAYKAAQFRWNIIDTFGCSPKYSGMNAGLVSRWTYNGDGIHPDPVYAPMLARYVYDCIINNISSYNMETVSQYDLAAADFDIVRQVYVKGDGTARISAGVSSYTSVATQDELGQLPDWLKPHQRQMFPVYASTNFNIIINPNGKIYGQFPSAGLAITQIDFDHVYNLAAMVVPNSP